MNNLRAVASITLEATKSDSDTAGAAEVDLQKYFVNPGKREMKAVVTGVFTTTDSGTFDYKLQESNTTVDSDFSDISGATATQVGDGSTFAAEAIHFFTAKRYVRGVRTIAGGTWAVAATLFAVKRDA